MREVTWQWEAERDLISSLHSEAGLLLRNPALGGAESSSCLFSAWPGGLRAVPAQPLLHARCPPGKKRPPAPSSPSRVWKISSPAQHEIPKEAGKREGKKRFHLSWGRGRLAASNRAPQRCVVWRGGRQRVPPWVVDAAINQPLTPVVVCCDHTCW